MNIIKLCMFSNSLALGEGYSSFSIQLKPSKSLPLAELVGLESNDSLFWYFMKYEEHNCSHFKINEVGCFLLSMKSCSLCQPDNSYERGIIVKTCRLYRYPLMAKLANVNFQHSEHFNVGTI